MNVDEALIQIRDYISEVYTDLPWGKAKKARLLQAYNVVLAAVAAGRPSTTTVEQDANGKDIVRDADGEIIARQG